MLGPTLHALFLVLSVTVLGLRGGMKGLRWPSTSKLVSSHLWPGCTAAQTAVTKPRGPRGTQHLCQTPLPPPDTPVPATTPTGQNPGQGRSAFSASQGPVAHCTLRNPRNPWGHPGATHGMRIPGPQTPALMCYLFKLISPLLYPSKFAYS